MRIQGSFTALLIATLGLACGVQSDDQSREAGGVGATVTPDASPPVESSESVALFATVPEDRLRGRVVHARTGQPWTDVFVRLQAGESVQVVRTTDTGHFVADEPLPDGEVLAWVGLNPEGPASQLEPVVFDHQSALADELTHLIKVNAGPSYRLEFLEHASDEPTRWMARVIERGERDALRTWSWQVLRPGDPPWLRYLHQEYPHDQDWQPFVEVRLREKDWFARGRVRSNQGEDHSIVKLELIQYAFLGGRLVDELGRPVSGAQLSLRLVESTEAVTLVDVPRTAWSDEEGLFEFPPNLEPGRYHLQVQSDGRQDVRLDVDLESGRREGFEVVLSHVEATEQLAVALVVSEGSPPPVAIVSLRSLDDPGLRRCLHTRMSQGSDGRVQVAASGAALLFEDLFPGRYELEVLPVDGRRYDHERLELELPSGSDGVVISEVSSSLLLRDLRFAVRGQGETQELESHLMRFSGEEWWFLDALRFERGQTCGNLAADGVAGEWMIWSEGYQPAYGRLESLEPGTEPVQVDVELRPGWGVELIMLDSTGGLPRPGLDSWQHAAFVHQAEPLEGVLALAGGQVVGRSDARGRLRIELEERPHELEFFKKGWRALGVATTRGDGVRDLRDLDLGRTAAVWFERSAP